LLFWMPIHWIIHAWNSKGREERRPQKVSPASARRRINRISLDIFGRVYYVGKSCNYYPFLRDYGRCFLFVLRGEELSGGLFTNRERELSQKTLGTLLLVELCWDTGASGIQDWTGGGLVLEQRLGIKTSREDRSPSTSAIFT